MAYSVWKDKDKLASAVAGAKSTRDVLIALGVKYNQGTRRQLREACLVYGITLPAGIANHLNKKSMMIPAHASAMTTEEWFVYGKKRDNTLSKKRLIALGWSYTCKECALLPLWRNEPLTIQLDHKDGNIYNNKLSNLQFLCPSCHSQTDTYAGSGADRYWYCFACHNASPNSHGDVCITCNEPRAVDALIAAIPEPREKVTTTKKRKYAVDPPPAWLNHDKLSTLLKTAKSKKEILTALQPGIAFAHAGGYLNAYAELHNLILPAKPYSVSTVSDEDWFKKGTVRDRGSSYTRLIESGRTEVCALCPTKTVWNKKPLKLQLDHKDNNPSNNTKTNLQFLCPNCHTQESAKAVKARAGNGTGVRGKPLRCVDCSLPIRKTATRCAKCNSLNNILDDYPTLKGLSIMFKELGSFLQVAALLGKSDNAVRKEIKRNGLDPKLWAAQLKAEVASEKAHSNRVVK